MPKVVIDASKGLFQKSGLGLAGTVVDHGTVANSGTITPTQLVNLIQVGSGSDSSTIATTNAQAGEIVIIVNTSGSNAASVQGHTVAAGDAALFVYTGSAWAPVIAAN